MEFADEDWISADDDNVVHILTFPKKNYWSIKKNSRSRNFFSRSEQQENSVKERGKKYGVGGAW